MKKLFIHLCLPVLAMILIVGCGPKPVADDGTGRPPGDIPVTTETTDRSLPDRDPEPDGTGVDVQVGGGQGVQVEIDREPARENQ